MIGLNEHFNYSKLIKFTIPTIIMMIFTSIYGVVDGVFVSNIVGSDAFAAVNLIMPVIMILGSVGFMIGTGGSALVAKTLGEGRKEDANRYFSILIYFLIFIGIILSILGAIFIRPIAEFLGAEGEILNDCVIYGRVMIILLTSYLLQNAFQSFLVVAEKPKMGLMISLIAGITNMFLDFLFMYVLKIGLIGAALATGISWIVGGIVPLIHFKTNASTRLKLVRTRFEAKVVGQASANGSSEMLTNLSMSLVNMLYNMQLMKIAGPDGVVAYGIIMYVSFIFSGTYIGYSIGAAPIIGYHYGADNKDELKSLFKKSLVIIGIAAIVLTSLAEIFAGALSGIFVSYDKDLLEMTTKAIRLFSLSFIVGGFNIFASSFFTALNNGFISALISFLRTLVFQVIMIFLLPAILGINGIWLAVVAAEFLSLIVSIVCFSINNKRYEYA